MKLNIIPTPKIAMLCAAFCAALFAFNQNAHALTLSIGDQHELGFVNFGIPSGDADRTAYVNHLIGMGLGTADTFMNNSFTRSNNNFGPLSTAVLGRKWYEHKYKSWRWRHIYLPVCEIRWPKFRI